MPQRLQLELGLLRRPLDRGELIGGFVVPGHREALAARQRLGQQLDLLLRDSAWRTNTPVTLPPGLSRLATMLLRDRIVLRRQEYHRHVLARGEHRLQRDLRPGHHDHVGLRAQQVADAAGRAARIGQRLVFDDDVAAGAEAQLVHCARNAR